MQLSDFPARFKAKVSPSPNGCWLWTASLDREGYGQYRLDKSMRIAHRVAYALAGKTIRPGLVLDHLCRNRACVNPDHLEPVTDRVNILRGVSFSAVNAGKTHCPAGHAYDEPNTYVDPTGRRHCRICSNARSRQCRARRLAKARAPEQEIL